jgi:hypothetical protein
MTTAWIFCGSSSQSLLPVFYGNPRLATKLQPPNSPLLRTSVNTLLERVAMERLNGILSAVYR